MDSYEAKLAAKEEVDEDLLALVKIYQENEPSLSTKSLAAKASGNGGNSNGYGNAVKPLIRGFNRSGVQPASTSSSSKFVDAEMSGMMSILLIGIFSC